MVCAMSGWWACAADGVVISVGTTDPIAVAQPQIVFDFIDPDTGTSDGPASHFLINNALADTGANGILLARGAYDDVIDLGFGLFFPENNPDPNRYDVQIRDTPPLTAVRYEEQGVAGSDFLDVLELYDVDLTASDGTTRSLSGFRALGSSDLDLGVFPAVFGMPVFWDTVTKLDQTKLKLPVPDPNAGPIDPNAFPHIGTGFMASLPAATSNSYDVDLRILPPEFPGQEIPDPNDPNDVRDPDPLPDFTGLPLIDGVTFEFNGQVMTDQTVLVDTGAQTSIIFYGVGGRVANGLAERAAGGVAGGGRSGRDASGAGGVGGKFHAADAERGRDQV